MAKRRPIDETFISDMLIIIFEEMLIVLSYDGVYIKEIDVKH